MLFELDWLALFTVVTIHSLVALVSGSVVTPEKIQRLRFKGQPSPWAFSAAWTVCYPLMASSFFLYWRLGRQSGFSTNWQIGMTSYIIHLSLNAGWCWVYFGLEQVKAAFGLLLLILASGVMANVYFFLQSSLAGGLFTPVSAWLLIALYYNFEAMDKVKVDDRQWNAVMSN